MGGNALKETHGLESKRMNLIQYNDLKENVSKFLDNMNVNYRHVNSYHNKSDFGDLDVVVSRENNAVDLIRNYLRIGGLPMTDEFREPQNVDIVSTLVDEHQVDFIFVNPEQLESASTYYSYNDIWNLLGKVIKTHDYKLGWQGLLYTYRNGNHFKEDIVLTHDLMAALEVMGLSVERYKQGFDTYEDMFDFVISCKAFDASKFAFENLNHRNRVRDKKRKTYNLFLNYVEGKVYPEPVALIKPVDKFPLLADEIKKRDDSFIDKNKAKSIINGSIIREITGKEREAIKNILQTFRSTYSIDEILLMSPEDVNTIVNRLNKWFD